MIFLATSLPESTCPRAQNVPGRSYIKIEDIASIFFSVTKDLDAEFPAVAARQLGLSHTPLLCLNEIDVPASLQKCVRILCHVNTPTPQSDIRHIYLKEAKSLRPDTVKRNAE